MNENHHWENPDTFQISLFILNNQFKFLTIFILITIWFTQNQSKINSIRAKLSEEEIIRSAYLNPSGRLYMFGGFMVGSVFLLTSIISIIFFDNRMLQYSASIFIQVSVIYQKTRNFYSFFPISPPKDYDHYNINDRFDYS